MAGNPDFQMLPDFGGAMGMTFRCCEVTPESDSAEGLFCLRAFVLAAESPGKEILNPVAIAIIGGLVSSTLLGLGVTPALFHTFCRKAAERVVARGAPATD